eukprot:m.426486 g.426486  ORF g.426486 m.426486 type:complete len:340 (+) comp20222_c5_seq1:749-1768(+)
MEHLSTGQSNAAGLASHKLAVHANVGTAIIKAKLKQTTRPHRMLIPLVPFRRECKTTRTRSVIASRVCSCCLASSFTCSSSVDSSIFTCHELSAEYGLNLSTRKRSLFSNRRIGPTYNFIRSVCKQKTTREAIRTQQAGELGANALQQVLVTSSPHGGGGGGGYPPDRRALMDSPPPTAQDTSPSMRATHNADAPPARYSGVCRASKLHASLSHPPKTGACKMDMLDPKNDDEDAHAKTLSRLHRRSVAVFSLRIEFGLFVSIFFGRQNVGSFFWWEAVLGVLSIASPHETPVLRILGRLQPAVQCTGQYTWHVTGKATTCSPTHSQRPRGTSTLPKSA